MCFFSGGAHDRLLDRPRRSDRNDGCRVRRWRPQLASCAGLVVASDSAERVSGRRSVLGAALAYAPVSRGGSSHEAHVRFRSSRCALWPSPTPTRAGRRSGRYFGTGRSPSRPPLRLHIRRVILSDRCCLPMKNGWTGRAYSIFRALFGTYLAFHYFQLVPWGPELFSDRGLLPQA